MKRIRVLVLGGAAVITIAGMSVAAASGGTSAPTSTRAQVVSQLQAAELRVAANPRAVAALQRAEVALQAQQRNSGNGQPTSPPPACPSAAPNAGNPQPCGVGGKGGGNGGGNSGGNPPPCPSSAPNAGHPQPCGKPLPTSTSTGGSTGGSAECGPKDEGGTAAAGPISSILYGIGVQISDGGGAPIGDLVQEVACAIYTNLSL